MRVLVAPGALDGLTAEATADAIATGWLQYDPGTVVDRASLTVDGPDGLQAAVDQAGLVARAQGSDLLVSATGTLDGGALAEGVVRGVAWVAQRTGVPCVVIAERVLVGRRELGAAGIDAAYELREDGLDEVTGERVTRLAARVARVWTPRRA